MLRASATINLLGKTFTLVEIKKEHGAEITQALSAFVSGIEASQKSKQDG